MNHAGDRPFGGRERRLLHLCSAEVVRLHGTWLAPWSAPSVSRLPPRLRQVLVGFFDGDSEKQVAVRLGVSAHTVHEYVRRLHRHFGVTSRGELLARSAPQLPALRPSGSRRPAATVRAVEPGRTGVPVGPGAEVGSAPGPGQIHYTYSSAHDSPPRGGCVRTTNRHVARRPAPRRPGLRLLTLTAGR